MTPTRLIITADDFGLSPSINEAVIQAYRLGILTSTSMVVNGDAFEPAVQLARQHPQLQVGLHLNLYRGRPITEASDIPSLVDRRTGRFLQSLRRVGWRITSGGFQAEDVYTELRAQADRLLAHGIIPTHLDSEKHLHHAPGIRSVVIRLAKELGVTYVRVVDESLTVLGWLRIALTGSWDKLAAGPVFRSAKREFVAAGLRVPARSVGFFRPIRRTDLARALMAPQEDVVEVICHPGLRSPEDVAQLARHGRFFVDAARAEELEALLDPRLRARLHGGIATC